MPTGNESTVETRLGWTYRYRTGRSPGDPLLVLLHGWTGDENSMWVFTGQVPAAWSVVAPRAPFLSPDGGYSWRERGPGERTYPGIQQLWDTGGSLLALLDGLIAGIGVTPGQVNLAGFSQGAAMALALLLQAPERFARVAALSGFLPIGVAAAVQEPKLAGRRVLVTHGRQDEIVPVEMAHGMVAFLEDQMASVQFCESDGGHKVSKDCMQAVASFFAA